MTIQTAPNQQDLMEFDEKKSALVRNTVCKDATQEEFEVFVEICKSTHLNPLFKQIYFIKRGGKPTHQTSIDGLRLIADRTKRYVPGREPSFTYDAAGALTSATSYVKKLTHDGTWHEVAATAIFKEYNANQGQWLKMPHIMIAKCAEALALRRAFPADMLGLYTKDEMDQADIEVVEPVVRENRTTQAQPSAIEEKISSSEAMEIENLLADEDKTYREDLLKYFSSKSQAPLGNFYSLPKKCLAACMKSITKRREERFKKIEVAEVEPEEQVDF